MPRMGKDSVVDAAVATHTADLDAHIKSLYEIARTEEYVSFHPDGGVVGSAVVANVLFAAPLFVPRTMTFDRIAIHVSTLSASGNARLGIYNNGDNLYPGTLLLDAGVVSVASTGVKAITISEQLTKGVYWLVVVTDGTPHLARHDVKIRVLGLSSTDLRVAYYGWKVDHSYAALPDPFTASGALTGDTDERPAVRLRLLSLD